jgi:hypothetical protein
MIRMPDYLPQLIVKISSQGNVIIPEGASKVRRGLPASQMITVNSIMQHESAEGKAPPSIKIEVWYFLCRLSLGIPVFKITWGGRVPAAGTQSKASISPSSRNFSTSNRLKLFGILDYRGMHVDMSRPVANKLGHSFPDDTYWHQLQLGDNGDP